MILAAGRGERLRPLTDDCPKPLLKVCGQSLIEYHLHNLANIGITEIIINHAWLGDKIEKQLGDGEKYGVHILYSPEKKALETGGGIKQALPLLSENKQAPFLVINGDIYIDSMPSRDDLSLPKNKLAKLFLVDNPSQHPEGDFALIEQNVLQTGKTKLTFSGIGVYHPTLFDNTPNNAFRLPSVLRPAMDKNLVTGHHYQGYWCDVGTMERLQQLEQKLIAAS